MFSWTSVRLSKCPIDKMILSQDHLTLWKVLWVPSVLAKNSITNFFYKWINFEMRHNIHCLLSKISLHSLTASWANASSLLPTVQLDFSWTLKMSDQQNDCLARTSDNLSSSQSSTWHDPEEIQTLRHVFQDKQILKEEHKLL